MVAALVSRPQWPPQTSGKLLADETEKWGKVIRKAGIKAE
jgi:hypothetical protein